MNFDKIVKELAELKTFPKLGGVKWGIVVGEQEISCFGDIIPVTTRQIEVRIYLELGIAEVWFAGCCDPLTSTSLRDALLEALEIVKGKVKEMSEVLGFTVLDKKQTADYNESLKLVVESVEKLKNQKEDLQSLKERLFFDLKAQGINVDSPKGLGRDPNGLGVWLTDV